MAPAMLDDPTATRNYRRSGSPPYPTPTSALPSTIVPREVKLRDDTTATILAFKSANQLPSAVIKVLCDQLNAEIEQGDTYPMMDPMSYEAFAAYWFGLFGTLIIQGNLETATRLLESPETDWTRECLGSYYIKPNYPGRSSHVCNAGFLVMKAARGKGVGRVLGESYLVWAPEMGYRYSVFNLVYENNAASCRIWDALGFQRIGRVPGCGNLKSTPGQWIDAIIYGRALKKD